MIFVPQSVNQWDKEFLGKSISNSAPRVNCTRAAPWRSRKTDKKLLPDGMHLISRQSPDVPTRWTPAIPQLPQCPARQDLQRVSTKSTTKREKHTHSFSFFQSSIRVRVLLNCKNPALDKAIASWRRPILSSRVNTEPSFAASEAIADSRSGV